MADISPVIHRTDGRVLGSFAQGWPSGHRNSANESVAVLDQMHARRVLVDAPYATGFCEFTQLEAGLYLSLMDLTFGTPLGSRVVGEDLFEFSFRVSGDLTLWGQWGKLNVDQPSTLIWFQPEGNDDVWEQLGTTANPRELSLTIYCSRKWLEPHLRASQILQESFSSFLARDSSRPVYRVVTNPPGVSEAVRSVLGCEVEGPLRLLFLRARGYELLWLLLRSLSEESPCAGGLRYFTQRDRENIAEARNILEAEFASPPTLTRLARRVGVNESKLNIGLRQLHGSTARQIVRERRMERARELLIETDLPISEVGFSVGYAHHSTFTAAFIERFGTSPKRFALSMRRNRA